MKSVALPLGSQHIVCFLYVGNDLLPPGSWDLREGLIDAPPADSLMGTLFPGITGFAMQNEHVPVRAWLSRADAMIAVVDQRNLHDRAAIPLPDGCEWGPAVAAVSAIGRSLVTSPSVARRALGSLDDLAVLSWFASGETWTALVEPAAADDAQRALHAALIGPRGTS